MCLFQHQDDWSDDKEHAFMQEQVVSLSEQLAQLRAQFEQKTNERVDLKDKADVMERRLEAASRLISGLASERSRWTSEIQVPPVGCQFSSMFPATLPLLLSALYACGRMPGHLKCVCR